MCSRSFQLLSEGPEVAFDILESLSQHHLIPHERVGADDSPQLLPVLAASLQHPECGPPIGNSIAFSQNVSLFRSDYFEFSLGPKVLQLFTASSCQWM